NETVRNEYKDKDPVLADLLYQARFGPNLVGLGEKLGYDAGNPEKSKRAKSWLYAWLTNPTDYHPRSLMPNPRLEPQERADIVAWLLDGRGNVAPLSQEELKSRGVTALDWKDVQVKHDDKALDDMVRMYLEKALPTRAAATDAL